MNLTELENFQLAKAINFNNDLNPQIFMSDDSMRPLVHAKLLNIADHFREFLGVQNIALVDIEVSGSNAAYSYTPHSDIDLHLIVDFSQLPDNDVYKELFSAKQYAYNDQHNIKIKGYDVELYVQDAAQPHHSLGSYSVLNNEWNRIPTKQRANLNDTATLLKYEKLKNLSIRALASDNDEYLNRVLDMVKKYRQAGLDKHGEFGPENLAFKMLRTDGYFAKLWAKKRSYVDQTLSLETKIEEPDTLAQDLMAEFNGSVSQTTEGMIKRLFAARESLFDEFDYDCIHATAGHLVTMEAAYSGNIGLMELMQFYKEASKEMIHLLQRLIAANKNKEAWELVQKVTGANLQGQQFNEDGCIVKGVNTTADVDVNSTKREAAKLGLTVDQGGIPPLLRTDGKSKMTPTVMESQPEDEKLITEFGHPDWDKFIDNPFDETLFRLPVYHATRNEFEKFERAVHGIFVSPYADYAETHYGSKVIPLYIDVRKPYNELDAPHVDAAFDRDYKMLAIELAKLKKQGYDAAYMGGDGNSYILIGDVPIVHAVTGKKM